MRCPCGVRLHPEYRALGRCRVCVAVVMRTSRRRDKSLAVVKLEPGHLAGYVWVVGGRGEAVRA